MRVRTKMNDVRGERTADGSAKQRAKMGAIGRREIGKKEDEWRR